MVKCTKCGTDLGPSEAKCPICGTPRSGQPATGVNIQYLASADRRVRRSIAEEENAAVEYEDLANLLELGGATAESPYVRRIAEDEKKHAEILRTVTGRLNEIIKRLER